MLIQSNAAEVSVTTVVARSGGAGRWRKRMRFAHSLSASQWMAAITLTVMAGICRKTRASSRSVRGSTHSSQNRVQDPLLGAAGTNVDDNALVRSNDAEVVAHIHVHERGHVEELATPLMDRIARALDCDDVAVAFGKRVVDLVDDRRQACHRLDGRRRCLMD